VNDAALLEVKYLQLLDLLYATQSVTRTAEHLDQTQSTVSIMLAALRKQLNDPLFVRTSNGMQPTPKTDAMIATVRSVLDQLRSLANANNKFIAAQSTRRFRIFMPDASHVTLLPRISSHVQALAPGIRLEAATLDATLEEALQSGNGDLALGSMLDLDAGFYSQTLFEEDWICLVNGRHPRLDKKFTLKQYKACWPSYTLWYQNHRPRNEAPTHRKKCHASTAWVSRPISDSFKQRYGGDVTALDWRNNGKSSGFESVTLPCEIADLRSEAVLA
jgi:DNA-binding transcriptional LysR family regulator